MTKLARLLFLYKHIYYLIVSYNHLIRYILKIFAVNLGYLVSFFYIVSVPKSNSNGTIKFLGIYESYKILLCV